MRQVPMLRAGNTVGMIAPAGPADREKVEQAIATIEQLGFSVRVGRSCFEQGGYLAGSDSVRAKDINAFFADPAIKGIFCLRGGYGTPRILDQLDLQVISQNPKVFLGYSDITALHLIFNQKAGFITFHGPMPAIDFIAPDFGGYNQDNLLRALMRPEPLGEIIPPDGEPPVETLSPGYAEGRLTGGNLSMICALLGTPFEIDTQGKILLLEDLGEADYRIDRMLTQLRLAGKLDATAGIVIGQIIPPEPKEQKRQVPVEEILKDILFPLNKPILKNVCFGHGDYKATFPLGALAILDGGKSRLIVTESGVLPSLTGE